MLNQTEVSNESLEPYNYEEIDLNQVSSVQQVRQDDVQVKDVLEEQSSTIIKWKVIQMKNLMTT